MNIFSFLHISLTLFFFGVWSVLVIRGNVISVLIAIELMLFACNFNFIFFSFHFIDIFGEIFSLFILTTAAAESAIGLAILVVYYRVRGTIAVDYISQLKG